MNFVAQVREVFGWDGDIVVSAGPRGALGQIWRLEVGPSSYALKEIFGNPPSEARIAAELAFAGQAAEAGVRFPASHPDRAGRYLIAAPNGRWLRLYDWVDLQPVDLRAQATPQALGKLFARLHLAAPTASHESTEPWYDSVPAPGEWEQVSARLGDRPTILPELCTAVTPADPAELIVCHRDLHPENVLADAADELVVVDWDNFGPAAPSRELARALFDWYCDDPAFDLDAMQGIYEAYLREGGPGRITGPADFSMLIASRLNFLLLQATIVLNPETEQRHREWAEREIDEALRILPTPRQLLDVLDRLEYFG